jgi:transcriptional regulator with XRE-family HTH domain
VCEWQSFEVAECGKDAVSDLSKLQKFLDDSYRVSYLDSHVKGSIAYQIQALREKEGLNQTQFGVLIGKPQSVVSRLEDTEYGSLNVNTLLQIANRLKIALNIRFCNFETILNADVSPAALTVENINETIGRLLAAASPPPTKNAVVSATIQGSSVWQTPPLPNQQQSLQVFQGSGTHNFGTSIPTAVSAQSDHSISR